jgi:hypothetical protein
MEKVKAKNLFKIIAIGFIIVICPAASWVYLQKGLNYQKEARKEIVVKQTLDVAKFIPEHIKEDSSLLDNRLRVILFDKNVSPNEAREELKRKLKDQFESSQGVFVLEFVKSKTNLSLVNERHGEMHLRKELSKDDYDKMISSRIGQPVFKDMDGKLLLDQLNKNQPLQENSSNFAILVDHQNGLRNFYDTTNPDRVKKLVEHMAILIPRKDIEKAELIREKEM